MWTRSILLLPLFFTMRVVASTQAAATPAVIFRAGTHLNSTYPCIRIPSAVTVGNVVLVMAECRNWAGDQCFVQHHANASREQEFNRSICQRRSDDGGRTFGPIHPNITRHYSANPSSVVISAQRLLLFFDDTVDGTLYWTGSNDAGLTWDEHATPLRDNVTGSVIQGVGGPGNSVVRLGNGVLLCSVYRANRSNATMFRYVSRSTTSQYNNALTRCTRGLYGELKLVFFFSSLISYAMVLRSTDNGLSWTNVSPRNAAGEKKFGHLGEPSLAVVTQGHQQSIVLDSRCPDGRKPYPGPAAPCDCNCRGVSVSIDAGLTWSTTK